MINPQIRGLLETALYVDDMARSAAFFEDVLGLRPLIIGERLTAFDTGGQGVLLIFKRGASVKDLPQSTGLIPGHDGAGPLHMAFKIDADAYDGWRLRLTDRKVTMRGEMLWPAGGKSLYFEDPDGHLLEMATPGLWATY